MYKRQAHPAFDKAAHYFGLKLVRVPARGDFRADVDAMRKSVTVDTVLVVGSAPSYPHGVVDPIAKLAKLAQERDILCHVDACVGGMMLPFVRKLGYPVPDWDFRVPGVTSISVDLHKYGYTAKGASVIVHRDKHLREEIAAMRAKMRAEVKADPRDLKHVAGGVVDLEFAVQALVLAESHRHPPLLDNKGNHALLRRAGEMGILEPALAAAAADAYLALRARTHAAALNDEETAFLGPDELAAEREAVTRLWKAVFG